MSRDARFWNLIARRYAQRPVPDDGVYAEKLRLTRARLAPGDRVVEIGCGTGSTALALADAVARLDAWDISPAMIAIAQEKAGAHPTLRFHVGDVAAALAEPGADAVLAHSLLHLLPDWRETIGRVHAALAPGGFLVSTTMCLADKARALRLVLPVLRPLGLLPPVQWFAADDLTREMEAAGFALDHVWQPSPRAARFIIARKQG
jgi:SAM-dependent methyltransferase